MNVLIVEDIPESQDMLREVATSAFGSVEYECVADLAGSRALGNREFALALIDLSLPDGSGTELIRRMTVEQPSCTVVVTTIYDDDEHVFSALRAGAQGYLHKHEPVEDLVRQLRGILDGQPPLSPAIARRILQYFRAFKPKAPDEALLSLTAREREVLGLLARGISIAAIARELTISPYTAGDHVKNIYRKLNISSRAEAALEARSLGLL
ncbi:response regulator transcription factor [Calidifontimicrobium sp. SYSU G02091]|uniref:response regulator n=1 Tax=Calidifontimicrobium sp. SYSU G02091 TaxID=2926421 RepID=UPI001F5319B8|nr:response regulator transcription factor [Calidifontimicrobium sp. SYSU G02091]MCI1192035.1 response regulator transcription factor [Calidifontimicrobium sp. SYSU G02091]